MYLHEPSALYTMNQFYSMLLRVWFLLFQSNSRKGKKKGRGGGGGKTKVNIKNSPILLRDGDTIGVKVQASSLFLSLSLSLYLSLAPLHILPSHKGFKCPQFPPEWSKTLHRLSFILQQMVLQHVVSTKHKAVQ